MRMTLPDGMALLHDASPRMRVLLALCFVLGVAVAVQFAMNRWVGYSASLDEATEMKLLEYQVLARNLAQGEIFETLHEELGFRKEELIASRMVTASTPPLSEAMFQHIVNDWAESSRVSILSMRVLPRQDMEGLSRMRMAITTRAEIGAIQNFMELVRQSDRFIFFEELEIKQIGAQERRFYSFAAQLTAWTMP